MMRIYVLIHHRHQLTQPAVIGLVKPVEQQMVTILVVKEPIPINAINVIIQRPFFFLRFLQKVKIIITLMNNIIKTTKLNGSMAIVVSNRDA